MMVRWMCGVNMTDRIASTELNSRLGIESVANVVRRGRLMWFVHVERKDSDEVYAAVVICKPAQKLEWRAVRASD